MDSVAFHRGKSQLIKSELRTCSSVSLLSYENIPIPDATTRTPTEVSSLLARFGDKWTHSDAINDLYFADAAAALRAAGKEGARGRRRPSAFERVRDKQYQTATVPEPLVEHGWQMVDEFNRSLNRQPASG